MTQQLRDVESLDLGHSDFLKAPIDSQFPK
jgi:hypothetical protein